TTVGGARTIRADVRIVAATNRDLAQLVAVGQFREDLFYRLNVVPVLLPALRARRQDIPLLARHFLDRAAEDGLPRKQLDPD
ncbi:nitrogen regulation protein NR(I), partial [Pseudomonas sp. FW305-130]